MTQTGKSEQSGAQLSPLKQAFLALQAAQSRVDELERERSEPVAIIGIGCRVPGGGEGYEGFWKLLQEKGIAVSDGMERRLTSVGRKVPLPEAARWAGLLDEIDGFDPQHFGISPREAVGIDPQQRLLLETCWEALEDAGVDPFSLYQSPTGVYLGIATHDYAHLQMPGIGLGTVSPHFASGIASSVAAGRISYVLGLNGPCVSLDTACSSSLVGLHLACDALRRDDCSIALAAGVNVILSPEYPIAFAETGMLSPRGLCHTFDEAADGFVRGEGCGVVVLKRLRDAQASGDRILAVVLGSAVNHDGAASGLTVPNGQAQQELLRQAHANARVEARQVGYVEAHGTGTSLGDPIEIEALGSVFGAGRKREHPLLLGSVKANLGHLEAAAGIVGVIKVVLSLQHGEIPPQPRLNRLNPHVRWGELPLEVVTDQQSWPTIEGRRIAGVSSFGFSGTNAHVVLEGFAEAALPAPEVRRAEVLVLTARTATALRQLAERYVQFLERTEEDWGDICHTAASGRAVFGERLAVVAADKEAAADSLRDWIERGLESDAVFGGRVRAGDAVTQRKLELPAAGITTDNEWLSLAKEVAVAFVHGIPVDWNAWRRGLSRRKVALPTYPFQRERYWVEAPRRRNEIAGEATGRILLGSRLPVAGVGAQFQTELSVEGANSWISEHVMGGRTVFPLTGHIELMLEAGAEALGAGAMLEDIALHRPLVVDGASTIQVVVGNEAQGRTHVQSYVADADDGWLPISEGWLCSEDKSRKDHVEDRLDLEAIRTRLGEPRDAAEFYASAATDGANFGPRFQGIERLWTSTHEALAEVGVRAAEENYVFAPWRLDACLQLIAAVRPDADMYLPSNVGEIRLYGKPGEYCWSHLRSRQTDADTLAVDVTVAHPNGSVLAVVRDMLFRRFTPGKVDTTSWFYRLAWKVATAEITGQPAIQRAILIGRSCRMPEIAASLREKGVSVQIFADATQLQSSEADVVLCFLSKDAKDTPLEIGHVVERAEEHVRLLLETVHRLLDASTKRTPRVYVVTEDACAVRPETSDAISLIQSSLAGAVISIGLEAPELRCTLLDLSSTESGLSAEQIAAEVMSEADDLRVAFRSDQRYGARLERVPLSEMSRGEQQATRLVLGTGIEGLTYETVERQPLQPDEIEIEVRATALNFRDVLKATGLLEHAGPIGTDCSGVILRTGAAVTAFKIGDPVVAIAPGCFASHVVTVDALAVRKPDELSFEQAAAQTVAYLTSDYCLNEFAHIRKGERVLIHAAAGGVGLAAVHLCQRAGAEIFATAGSDQKREYLRNLGIEHVLDSRSLDFRNQIIGGVDVVLNSLAGEAIDAGLDLLRPNGRFIELGKTDIREAGAIERRWPGIQYIVADLTVLFEERSPWIREHLTALLNEIARGDLPALPSAVYEERETKQAFRHMAAAKHIGRLVIRSAVVDFAGGAHLITGGLRGIGLRLAEWLVEQGARDLVLAGRQQPSGEALAVIRQMEISGAKVRVVQGDVAEFASAQRMVAEAGASLRGVWHCAGVIDDGALAEQYWERFARVMNPKVEGSWNLHVLTRELRPEFFVLFSSWASVAGSRGQANYSAANAFLDGLAMHRRTEGLSALCVDWGAWGESGMAAGATMQRYLARAGMESMRPQDAFTALISALRTGESRLAIASIQWPIYLEQVPSSQRSFYAERIEEVASAGKLRQGLPAARSGGKSQPSADARALQAGRVLSEILASPASARRDTLQRVIEDVVRRTLDLRPSDEIDPEVTFNDLGMDSLLAIELRNSLSTILERRLPSTLLFDYPTLRKLARFLEEELFPNVLREETATVTLSIAPEPDDEIETLSILDEIEQLSDEEVDSILGKGAY